MKDSSAAVEYDDDDWIDKLRQCLPTSFSRNVKFGLKLVLTLAFYWLLDYHGWHALPPAGVAIVREHDWRANSQYVAPASLQSQGTIPEQEWRTMVYNQTEYYSIGHKRQRFDIPYSCPLYGASNVDVRKMPVYKRPAMPYHWLQVLNKEDEPTGAQLVSRLGEYYIATLMPAISAVFDLEDDGAAELFIAISNNSTGDLEFLCMYKPYMYPQVWSHSCVPWPETLGHEVTLTVEPPEVLSMVYYVNLLSNDGSRNYRGEFNMVTLRQRLIMEFTEENGTWKSLGKRKKK